MTEMITADLVRLDVELGSTKEEVIRALADVVATAGRTSDADTLVVDALARESTSATGLPGGIAIPHCRTEAVQEPTLVFARLAPPVDFGAKDGPADLAFLIAAPAGGDATHLQVLTKLARALVKSEFTQALRGAESADRVVELVSAVVSPQGAAAPAPTPAPTPAPSTEPTPATAGAHAGAQPGAGTHAATAPAPDARPSLVAVTACPTGIAHTYMAAEALEAAAERAGVDIHVETQGSAGSTPLAREVIAAASAVIFAVDVGVRDRSRFAGKPVVSSGVKRPIDDGDAMIAEALRYAGDPGAPRVEGDASAAGADGHGAEETWGGRIRRVLMTGVSYMIPFVAAGGLLIALGFLFGGYEIVNHPEVATDNTLFNLPDPAALELDHALFGSGFFAYLGGLLFVLGGAAFGFLVPALAGYIAYAIADRPGIAPGFVMGAIANTLGTGFIGGIIGGVLAGVVAHWIASRPVPHWARGLMPVLVIPLGATLVSGLVMVVLLGRPLIKATQALTDGLTSLGDRPGLAILLGVVLGLMMAFDMGGPLNKTAYAFATAGLGAAATATDAPELKVMAAVMLAGMVPPLALALATVVRPRLFTVPERENGKAAWLMGASFITEGAIPFAAADPLRVIPSIMAGSAVTGGLAMAFDVTLRAPHGGIFVLFAVGNIIGFLIALIAGMLVAAAAVIGLKSLSNTDTDLVTV
ncbi:PTS fructose transporter subunit IIABC [Nocardioides donggukensis]|uniref:PTS sugar transporter subunit IIA n=1 Tax=Nocardioides donggukensis TaxID=2774019 RepID=A0A927K4S6_9ACTN|nr:fructose-specific PTS transporter subunit EIIC [Nocardioides donggukensis]MBD8869090.1 PTS sugar transporter subunit IIA [Nocardioides donggukensis]